MTLNRPSIFDDMKIFGWWIQYVSHHGELCDREGYVKTKDEAMAEKHCRIRFAPMARMIENVAVWEQEGGVPANYKEYCPTVIIDKDFQLPESYSEYPSTTHGPPINPMAYLNQFYTPKPLAAALDTYPVFEKVKFVLPHCSHGFTPRFYDVFPREKPK